MTDTASTAGTDRAAAASTERRAVLYRMASDRHLCPFGLKARHLLKSHGYAVDDRTLADRAATDAFKAEHDVKTTPQVFIDGTRIGGHDDLRRFLGLHVADKTAMTYEPVIAIFAMTALMAAAIVLTLVPGFNPLVWAEWFIAFSMCVLAVQKLRDVAGFSNGFLGYDLLACRWVPYATVYPYAEAFAGLGMIAVLGASLPQAALPGIGAWLVWPVVATALFIGAIGAASVVKAVYIDKRALTCACVGGNSNVPLGAISLTENVMMVVMALWMLAKMMA